MKLLMVQLSDIHVKNDSDRVLGRSKKIAESIYRYIPDSEVIYLVFSGDIAFSGKEDEYIIANKFINEIVEDLKREKPPLSIYKVFSPGNHDCDFSVSGNVRDSVIASVRKSGENFVDDEVIDQCISVQQNYRNFVAGKSCSSNLKTDDYLWQQYEFVHDGYKIIFDCLNMSWMSELNEKYGHIVFPLERFQERQLDISDLRVIVLHQPPNWLKQGVYQDLRSFLKRIGDIILTGHEHHQTAYESDDIDSENSVFIEGAALQPGSDDENSGFNVIVIDTERLQYLVNLFEWDGKSYSVKNVSESWEGLRKLAEKHSNEFIISKEFCAFLRDPGANFSHQAKEKLELSDFFIYPDIEDLSEDGNARTESSIVLNNIDMVGKGVFIKGDEKSGKTALLRRLYLQYHESGYVPIILNGDDIKTASDKGINSVIEGCVKEQYGIKALEKWRNLSKSMKILLLDDFDKVRVSDRYNWKIIEFVNNTFGSKIVTADEIFEINEAVSFDLSNHLAEYRHYKIKPFGYKLRHSLIKKWQRIGDDYSLSSSELITRVDNVEKIFNKVLGNNLVPRVPIYLLTLLQSAESSVPNNLQNSASGYYYQYLITDSMYRYNVKVNELDEFFNYCSHLAWFFKQSDFSELEYDELCKFNDVYSDEFTKVDCSKRLQILCNARILQNRGGYYSFVYRYQYYFFLGKYLSDQLSANQEVVNLISHSCKHLYVKDNANMMLFLTHHSKEPFIIECILDNLRNLFSDKLPISLEGDTDVFNSLAEETSKLVYLGKDPEQYRQEESELRDKYSDDDIGDDLEEQDGNKLDISARINTLLKTIEILSQILRNYYGSLKKPIKKSIVDEVYSGPLRALRALLETIEEHKDILLVEIEALIESKNKKMNPDERKKLAQKFVFDFVGTLTFALMMKSATSTGSENLLDVLKDVVEDNPTIAYKLISLASRLDNPVALPMDEIESLSNITNKNILAHRLLETIVLRHIYLFKVSEREKQKLCNMLGITMAKQRSVDLVSANSKLAPDK